MIIVGPTCPESFFLYPAEEDGRTCYSNTTGEPPANFDQILQNCKAPDNYLQRPGVPSRPDLIDLIKPAARYVSYMIYAPSTFMILY